MNEQIEEHLNLEGLRCPMPILKLKQALSSLPSKAKIAVTTTDPHSEIDFKAFLGRTEHQLLISERRGERFYFLIEKA